MKRLLLLAAGSLLLGASSSAPGPGAPPATLRRFVLVVGSNDGGAGRVPLRYATSDASAFARVLEQLGGVDPSDAVVLLSPGRAGFFDGLSQLTRMIQNQRAYAPRSEVLVYYSGHSDETGLLLSGERIAYPELKEAIRRIPADVRIAILDSCSSGALIREKGGKHLPAFLVDDSAVARGHAFLTASSATEAAQESDRIQGSFFTYALISGLRGAADSSHDGKVTLNEAYQFAFDETLARTEKSRSGPQHPSYDIQLAGSGDLVMTDLRSTGAGLVLAEDLDGRLYLRDGSDRLVAELRKEKGFPMELGLEAGSYAVTLERDGALLRSKIELVHGQRAMLKRDQMVSTASEVVATRGAEPEPPRTYREVPINLTFFSPLNFTSEPEPNVHSFSFNLLAGRSAKLRGLEIGLGLNMETEDSSGVQLGFLLNMVQQGFSGAQVSAGANVVGGELHGVQIAAGVNAAMRARGRSAQITSGANLVFDEMEGVQIGGFSYATTLRGFQIGTVGMAQEVGGQFGAVNIARSSNVQVGALNLTERSCVQVGAFNIDTAETVTQIGAFNIEAGETVTQIGALNIAREASGVQIAALNIAEHSDYPIGVLNLVRDGYHAVGLWVNELGAPNFGLKLGGTYLYTFLAASIQPKSSPRWWTGGGGIGGHVPLGKFFVDIEAASSSVFEGHWKNPQSILCSARANLGWQILPSLAIVGGPSFNVLVSHDSSDVDLGAALQRIIDHGATTVRLFPGLSLGLQI